MKSMQLISAQIAEIQGEFDDLKRGIEELIVVKADKQDAMDIRTSLEEINEC